MLWNVGNPVNCNEQNLHKNFLIQAFTNICRTARSRSSTKSKDWPGNSGLLCHDVAMNQGNVRNLCRENYLIIPYIITCRLPITPHSPAADFNSWGVRYPIRDCKCTLIVNPLVDHPVIPPVIFSFALSTELCKIRRTCFMDTLQGE